MKRPARPTPALLLVPSLLVLLPWLPPETRGESMAGCALLVGLLALLRWHAGASRAATHALLVTGAAAALLLALAATAPAAAVAPLSFGLLAVAAGLTTAWSSGDERLARLALLALVVAAAGVSVFALLQKLWGFEQSAALLQSDPTFPDRAAILTRLGRGRVFAGFATPAALGGFLAIALPATAGLARSLRGRARAAALAAAGLQVAALLASASATAAAALCGALGLAAVLRGHARRSLAAGVVLLLVVVAAVGWMRGERLLDPRAEEGPWRLRAGNFRSAAAMAADHPWTGVGPGGFAANYPRYRLPGDNETRHAHDLPLELAAEWGWPAGGALSLLFFGALLGPLWRERRSDPRRLGLAVGLAAFALQNLADFTAFMPSLLWSAALLRGLLAAPRTGPSGPPPPTARVLAGVGLAAVLVAVPLAALHGLSAEARRTARFAAFDGDLQRALPDAERASRLAPWDVDAALLLARLTADTDFAREGRPSHVALERGERAVRLSPVSAAARELRGRLRLATGDAPGAYADLAEAARLHPVHAGYAAARDDLAARLTAAAPDGRP